MFKKIILLFIFNLLILSAGLVQAQLWPFAQEHFTYKINNKNNLYFLVIDLKKDCLISSDMKRNFTDSIKIVPENNSNLKDFKFHLPVSERTGDTKLYYKNQLIIPLEIKLHKNTYTELNLNIELTLCKEGCILHKGNIKFAISNDISKPNNYLLTLKVLLFAFLGGVILNFMPCVLPLISLKIYQISTLSNQENKSINLSLLGTIIGIMLTMLLLALITLFLKNSGETAGLGFHFQEPNFIITLIIFCLIITLTATNNYHYALTNILNKILPLHKNIEQHFLSGILNGIFLALISTPCTAPFLGVAAGYALSSSTTVLILIYLCIGLGLASIYILILLNKKLIKYVPKSKKWNNYLSTLSQISLYGIMLWLIFILNGLTSVRVAAIIFCLCLMFKFIILNKGFLAKFWPIKYILLLVVIIIMYIIPQKIISENNTTNQIITKFWQTYDQKQIDDLVNQGNIILIDVTADWCITCKINHLTTLDNVYVIKQLQQARVKAFRADITKHTPNEIHQLMRKFNRHGIPLNVLYSKQYPNGLLLDIVLLPSGIYNFIK